MIDVRQPPPTRAPRKQAVRFLNTNAQREQAVAPAMAAQPRSARPCLALALLGNRLLALRVGINRLLALRVGIDRLLALRVGIDRLLALRVGIGESSRVLSILVICAMLLPSAHSAAQESSSAAAAEVADNVDETVQRAIKYLMSKQRADGAIVEHQNETTMTSLAIMAMASAGATASENSQRGQCLRKALNFVLTGDRQDKDGYFGNRDGSRMYGHGITTLMLTEMLGMGADAEQDALIYDRCQKAINLILSAQKQSKRVQDRGGWRYTPNSNDSDLSVSVWQLMALRSAKNDGLDVPAEAIEQAIDYLKRSYTSRLDSRGVPIGGPAGFSYIPDQNNPTYTMTAAGLLAMQVCGEYESPVVAGAADWLLSHPPQWNERFFFYGTYYYAQGMYQRGGEHAATADRLVRQLLLDRQQPDGSWTAPSGEEGGAGKVYSTSLAVLSLSVKYHYLPIYQK